MWAASYATWLEEENYWTEQNVCWNILTEKIPASLGAVSLGTRPENQKKNLKNAAAGLLEIHTGCLETRDILRYHQKSAKTRDHLWSEKVKNTLKN